MAKKAPAEKKSPSQCPVGHGGELQQQAEASHPVLTTQQGIPVADNQNSLKQGPKGPTLLEDFILREKITHFDHERIPERIVHARGTGVHGYFQLTDSLEQYTTAKVLTETGKQVPVFVRFSTVRRRRLGGHPAGRARLRHQVLYRRGQLGSGRQQHSGVLHPGRHEIPRPGPCREDGAGPGLSTGRHGARHVLGLHLPHARVHAHGHVDHERPHHRAQPAHDRGLWRAQFPAGQCARQKHLREIPLAA